MLKNYAPFAFVSSLMTIFSTQAFCTDVFPLCEGQHKSNGHLNSKIVASIDELKLNSQSLTSEEFEELHQNLFKKQDFDGAAIALLGSAITGHTENMDYLLTVEPRALQYIRQNDDINLIKIVASISHDLVKQFKVSQSKPQSQELLSTNNYFTEGLSKK